MPDLFQTTDREPAPVQGPVHAEPDAEQSAHSGAEQSQYRAIFVETFGDAYNTPAEPDRGARVMADVEAEARTFGDEWTVQSLAAERFGPAAQPQFNDWLANSLQTDAGEQAVLHALKDGSPAPGTGEDIVVLLDREAAFGFGHTAVLVGNDRTGWDLYSKDGSANSDLAWGPSTWTNGRGRDQTTGPLSQHFDTLDAFFETQAASKQQCASSSSPGCLGEWVTRSAVRLRPSFANRTTSPPRPAPTLSSRHFRSRASRGSR